MKESLRSARNHADVMGMAPTSTTPTSKPLNDIEIGDVVLSYGSVVFTEPSTVREVQRFDTKTSKMVKTGGSVVVVFLAGGRFWPMSPGVAETITITCEESASAT